MLRLSRWRGRLCINFLQNNSKGKEYTEADDMFVDAPDELVGKEVNFVFKIVNCRGIPNKYTVRKMEIIKWHITTTNSNPKKIKIL